MLSIEIFYISLIFLSTKTNVMFWVVTPCSLLGGYPEDGVCIFLSKLISLVADNKILGRSGSSMSLRCCEHLNIQYKKFRVPSAST